MGPGLALRAIRGGVDAIYPPQIPRTPLAQKHSRKIYPPPLLAPAYSLMRHQRLRPLQPILRAFAALLHRWLGFVLFCLQKRDEVPDHHTLNFYEHELKRAIFARAFATAPKINFRVQATKGHFHRRQRHNWLTVITRGLC
jgi:hypothetical protein